LILWNIFRKFLFVTHALLACVKRCKEVSRFLFTKLSTANSRYGETFSGAAEAGGRLHFLVAVQEVFHRNARTYAQRKPGDAPLACRWGGDFQVIEIKGKKVAEPAREPAWRDLT
jgi:hypothetical protein